MTIDFELLDHEYIELMKLLKVLSLVESGGQAKMFIDEGLVAVNGTIEHQKRKKLKAGDIVEFNGQTIKVF